MHEGRQDLDLLRHTFGKSGNTGLAKFTEAKPFQQFVGATERFGGVHFTADTVTADIVTAGIDTSGVELER